MPHPFAALCDEYTSLLRQMKITRIGAVNATARKLIGFVDENRYADVSAKTGVPQIVMAASFEREASSNFHLSPAQGDPWNHVSHHVPAGRGPFDSWAAAAEDAYHIDHLDAVGAANWSWERGCFDEELFNGFGPRNHGKHTGYLWAGSNIYTGGKYVADGVWNPDAIDSQLGVIPMMVGMVQLRSELALPFPFPGDLLNGTPIAAAPPMPQPVPEGVHDAAALQAALNKLGADPQLDVDDNYGRNTRRAVAAFQGAHGLATDGIAGPATWDAVTKLLTRKQHNHGHHVWIAVGASISVLGAAAAFIGIWVKIGSRITANKITAENADKKADAVQKHIDDLNKTLAIQRETSAKDFGRLEAFNEGVIAAMESSDRRLTSAVSEMTASIRHLTERFDRFIENIPTLTAGKS